MHLEIVDQALGALADAVTDEEQENSAQTRIPRDRIDEFRLVEIALVADEVEEVTLDGSTVAPALSAAVLVSATLVKARAVEISSLVEINTGTPCCLDPWSFTSGLTTGASVIRSHSSHEAPHTSRQQASLLDASDTM